jgi:kinesin family protein 3/17
LDLKEEPDRGVYVKGLTKKVVESVSQMCDIYEQGNGNRTVGETLMNKDSSRSHSIFIVDVETSEPSENKEESTIKQGVLNLVDLAGSERQKKTEASGVRLKEAAKINLSLSALGNVISALVSGKVSIMNIIRLF